MAFHLRDGWLLAEVRRSLNLESVFISRIPAEQGNMHNLLRSGLRDGQGNHKTNSNSGGGERDSTSSLESSRGVDIGREESLPFLLSATRILS